MSTPQHSLSENRLLKVGLTSLAIGLLFCATWKYRAVIAQIWDTANLPLLSVSVLLTLLANYLTGLPFNGFLRQNGIQLPWTKACYLQLVIQATKYIPGNIWGAILQAKLIGTQRFGAMFLAGIDTTLFFILTVSTSGLAMLVFAHHSVATPIVAMAGWGLAAAIATSSWLLKLIVAIAQLLGKHLETSKATAPHEIGRFFLFAFVHSVVQVSSVATLLMATSSFTFDELLIGTASILLAWVIGTAALIVPSGLVVREVAFVSLATVLGASTSLQKLTAIAIIARAMQTIPDILATAIVVFFEAKNKTTAIEPMKNG